MKSHKKRVGDVILKAFYCLLTSVSVPEVRAFKVSEILRKNAIRKLREISMHRHFKF